jgi:rhodanese-related sulfurtransferase
MPESQPVEIATISREELKEKIDRKDRFVLVETLPANYYNHDHLPGAINLPPDQIAQLAPKVLPDKTAEIIVYCARLTWNASENAARELAAMGYTNIRDYAEGKQGWIEAGLPTEGHNGNHRAQ